MTFRKRNWKVMCVWLFFCESFSLFSVGIFSLPTVNKLRIFCHHIFWKCVWIFNREKRLYISIKIFAWFHNSTIRLRKLRVNWEKCPNCLEDVWVSGWNPNKVYFRAPSFGLNWTTHLSVNSTLQSFRFQLC